MNLISRRIFTVVALVLFTALLIVAPNLNYPNVGYTAQPWLVARQSPEEAQRLLQQGREFYQARQFAQAVSAWQQAAQIAAARDDRLTEATALSNLALAQQQLGAWSAAREAIITSLKRLGIRNGKAPKESGSAAYQQVVAQTFNTQGKLYFAAGQFELALESWQQATDRYRATRDAAGATQSLLNQTQALKALGLHRRAGTMLEMLYRDRQQQSPPLQLAILLNYGDALRLLGRLADAPPDSQTVLQQGLNLATQLQSESNVAAFLVSLGNTARAQQTLQATRYFDQPDDLKQIYREALLYHQQTTQTATLDPNIRRINALLDEQTALVEATFMTAEQLTEAQALSSQIQAQIDRQPPSPSTVHAYLRLAENRILIDPESANTTTIEILAKAAKQAETLGDFQMLAYARWRQYYQQALQYYQQAADIADTTSNSYLHALLNQQSLLLEGQAIEPRQRLQAESLSTQIQAQLERRPLSHTVLYAQIHFAQNLLKIDQVKNRPQVIQQLEQVAKQAEQLQDVPTQSYALGYLGSIYERDRQWQTAQSFTQRALSLAQATQAGHLIYRWQWQLGRLLKAQNNIPAATAIYTQAVESLNTLRKDLATINTDNADVQFSFRLNAEPVYLELVELLLSAKPSANGQNLEQARSVIESLQIAELEDFFREACNTAPVPIEGVDAKAATIYPIMLKDRLDVIISLYDAKAPRKVQLRHYSLPVTAQDVERTSNQFRQSLIPSAPVQDRFVLGQRLYDWLIRPAEADLHRAGVKTLVFIMNGNLRNIPMAALYDGNQFLIQKYHVALTPGLRLIDPQPLARQSFNALVAGLTQSTQGFPALPSVETEVREIKSMIPSRVILNEGLTNQNLQQELSQVPFNAIHLATHGQFSSIADQTFILTWDQKMNVRQFDDLLRTSDKSGNTALELLVLSACQTASGDRRAALGLAGIAVRSGARSTVASLWPVNDETTADFMTMFYQALNKPGVSKAEALGIAQTQLLSKYPSPYYWAPFVLVGNWL